MFLALVFGGLLFQLEQILARYYFFIGQAELALVTNNSQVAR